MSREFRFFIDDMIRACQKIDLFVGDLDKEQFFEDARTFDAVLRNLEIIGEAAKHVPEAFRAANGDVPWKRIMGFRDIVAHEYFGLDRDILWDIVNKEVPMLLERLRRILL